jgi:hypothetical protein
MGLGLASPTLGLRVWVYTNKITEITEITNLNIAKFPLLIYMNILITDFIV